MGYNLIFAIKDEPKGDDINRDVYFDLLHRALIKPNNDKAYTFKRYHPTKKLVAFIFKLGKTPTFDESIRKYVNESELVDLDDTWSVEIT